MEFLTGIRGLWQALHATHAEYTRCRQREGSCSGPLSRSCPLCDSLPGPRSRYAEYRLRSCGVSGRYERRSAGRLSGIVQSPRTIELCYFPVFRVRPWTDEPFIGDVRAQQLSNPGARAPGERRQPMRGAPPLSQGRRWGCSQHAHCVCICTAGRRMVVSSRAKTQQSRWGCGCTWSKCIGLSSERLAAADPCAFLSQCILLALFNFSRGVVGQTTTRLGGFFFWGTGLEADDDTTFRSETRMPKPVQHWGLGTPDLPQEETIT